MKIFSKSFLMMMALILLTSLLIAQTGTINTRVWDDQNGNGRQDESVNLANVTVNLLDADNNLITSASTNSSGIATFVVSEGTYKLEYVLPVDHAFTLKDATDVPEDKDSDCRTDNGRTGTFTLAAGSTVSIIDAGMWSPGSVNARVWDDRNGNGRQDEANNVAGVTVHLLESDNSAVVEPGMGPVTAVTDANGIATLGYVPANRAVKLQFDILNDHAFTLKDESGVPDDKDSDARTDNGRTATFQASRGNQTFSTWDAGMWTPGSASVRIWDDINGNGRQDEANNINADVSVKLIETDTKATVLDNNGNPVEVTVNDGLATLGYVPADREVQIEITIPADHRLTTKDADGVPDDKDSDFNDYNRSPAFQANRGYQHFTSVDAGMWSPGSAQVRIWDDINGNGRQDEANNINANVTVKLIETDTKATVLDNNGNPVEVTVNDGMATLSYVPADREIQIEITIPADHQLTTNNADGVPDDKDSDFNEYNRSPAFSADRGNDFHSTIDAGMWSPGSAQVRIWDDINGNGRQDETNNITSDVTVKLIEIDSKETVVDGDGNPVLVTVSDGLATLGYVPADREVQIEVSLPADHKLTLKDAAGVPDDKDSDFNDYNRSPAFQASRGQQVFSNIDCGMWAPGIVKAKVWEDFNGNGRQDDGSIGIYGLRVNLLESNNTPVTRPDGSEVFALSACGTFEAVLDYVPADRPVKLEFIPFTNGVFTEKDKAGVPDNKDSDARTDNGRTNTFQASKGSQIFTSWDAGFATKGDYADATINSFVWDDRNADGNHVGESSYGIQGVNIRLTDLNGNTCDCETTNADGKASLMAIADFTNFYKLGFDLKEDHRFTIKSGPITDDKNSDAKSDGSTDKFSISTGQTIDYIEAGMFVPGTLNTFVFDDRNADGNHQGEGAYGIDGVTVELTEVDGTTPITYPKWHPKKNQVVTASVTDASGVTFFDYIPADRFIKLKYTLKDGHKFTLKSGAVTEDKNNDAKSDGTTDKFQMVRGSENIKYVECGMLAPGTLSTFVFDDRNADGNHQGEGAFGIEGVLVDLVELDGITVVTYPVWHPNAGNPIPTQTTDVSGAAFFDYVPTDRFTKLKYTLKDDYKFTLKSGPVTNDKNNDAKSDGTTDKFIPSKGSENISYVECGMIAPGTLNTFVFDDRNADGTHQGEGAFGIGGVTVQLMEIDGSTVVTYPGWHPNAGDDVTAPTTDMAGLTAFDYVPANRFVKLKYTLPADHKFTTKTGAITLDNNNDAKSDGTTDKFQIVKGSEVINYVECGLWAPGTLETFVWHDIDDDGNHQGEGSLGVSGIVVNLLETNYEPVLYPAGHPKAGQSVTSITDCTDGKAFLDYLPADRQLRLEYVGTEVVFTSKTGAITFDNNSDAKPDGTTDKFSVSKGSHYITYVETGLAELGIYEQLITLPACINDQDLSWIDQDGSTSGIQLEIFTGMYDSYSSTNLVDDGRYLKVYATTCSTIGQQGFLGWYTKGGPDGSYLKFKVNDVYQVGNGSHFVLEVTFNSLSGYTGSRADKIAFRDDYPVGMLFTLSLEFYDEVGNDIVIEGCPNNNLPDLRNMYVISTEKQDPATLAFATQVELYPVPAASRLNIRMTTNKDDQVNLMIVGSQGNVVVNQSIYLQKGINMETFDVTRLAPGPYFLVITSDDGLLRKSFIVTRR